MKKSSNRLHSLFAALAALVLAAALAVPAFAVEGGFADLYYRMFDDAEVLTEDEDNELEDALEELSLRQSFDVTIATIESMESVGADSMEQFADDLYDYCQYGYGPDMDGVLLLVSVGDRKWHISTCGYGITAFTDAGIQYLGQQMTPFMADGDYAGAFRTFVQWSDTYIGAARAGHPYDVNNLPREPLSLMYLFLALGIGLVLAWVVVSVMKSQLRSVAFQENAASYVREGSMFMNPYLSEKARGEIPRVLKWLRNAGLAFCVFCSFGGLYTLCLSLQDKDYSHIGGYVFWIVVGAVPLALFARGEARRYHARTIARRVESYSGPEVPLRWLCNSVGMDTKDIAWYFENGYFANLSLDLNQKIVRRRTVPRHDPNRG